MRESYPSKVFISLSCSTFASARAIAPFYCIMISCDQAKNAAEQAPTQIKSQEQARPKMAPLPTATTSQSCRLVSAPRTRRREVRADIFRRCLRCYFSLLDSLVTPATPKTRTLQSPLPRAYQCRQAHRAEARPRQAGSCPALYQVRLGPCFSR